ncbi:MAG: TfoX/Sxy family protein [Hyphomicrobiales bacterium]
MPVSSEFLEHVVEVLEEFGPVEARRMFGGAGIFRDNLMFILIVDETLYFKADENNAADFDAEGLEPFIYDTKKGPRTINGLRLAPEICLEDPSEMARWAQGAFDAALKADARKPAKDRKRVPGA